jgi:1-acyl-sn-glycerol-3-phosphate acyltransferase
MNRSPALATLRAMTDAAALERTLEVIARIVGADAFVSATVTLGDLGVDSLAFAEIAAALRERGIHVADDDVTAETTIAELATANGRDTASLPPGNGRFLAAACAIGRGPLRWWFDLEVTGREHLPRAGAILAMNHESALDIPLVAVACPRPITFMAKEPLFAGRFAAYWLNALGAFRVDRERFDLVAIERALGVLASGEVLGMFPEGTRAPGRLLPFLPGAAWLALATGAPIVPCALAGTELAVEARRPRRARVRVGFRPAIAVARVDDPGERRRLAPEITAELRQAISSHLPARLA